LSIEPFLRRYKAWKPRCVGGEVSSTRCAHRSDDPPSVDDKPVTQFVPFMTGSGGRILHGSFVAIRSRIAQGIEHPDHDICKAQLLSI
jgi:hypothetical protein